MSKLDKNRKKEAEKRRGFYSELITDVAHQQPTKASQDSTEGLTGANKRTNLLWQVLTERHAPIIRELPPPEKQIFLAPAQRWKTYDEEPSIVSLLRYNIVELIDRYASISIDISYQQG